MINLIWAFIKKYLGWRNWAVFVYNSIFENLFVLFFIALYTQNFTDLFLYETILFLLFSIFSTTYGYLINDYADIDLDREHGKENTFANDSKSKAFLISISFLVLSIFSGLPFSSNQDFALLWFAWITITTFYSLPPFRLKERGKTGLVFVVFAQRLIPVLLVFTAFNFPWGWELALMATYVFFRGISSDVNHQLEDYQNDIETATNTFAVATGVHKVQKILRASLEFEKVLLTVILFAFFVLLHSLDFIAYGILVISGMLYFGMLIYGYLLKMRNPEISVNPFKANAGIFQFLHHSYPSVLLAVTLNVILIYYNWKYFVLFLLLGLLRGLFSPSMIKNSFIYKFLKLENKQ